MKLIKITMAAAFSFVLLGMAGCAAIGTSVAHKDLNVQTKMTQSIFLNPVEPDQRTVFIQYRNTTDKPVNVESQIASAVMAKGFKIIQDPAKAHYWLQVNVLQVGMVNPTAAKEAGAGSGAASGALIGGAAGAIGSNNATGTLAGAVIGGVAGEVINNSVHDVTYTMVTDVQIAALSSQNIQHGGVVTKTSVSGKLGQTKLNNKPVDLSGTKSKSSIDENTAAQYKGNRVYYKTRVISTANKVNLQFPEALPALEQGLSQSIGNLF